MFSFIKSLFGGNPHKNAGVSLLDEGRFEEAVAELKLAHEKSNGRDETILLSLGHALFELRRFAEAVDYLKIAAENASTINPVPSIMLGYAYLKSGDAEEAEKSIKKALKIDVKHPAARYYMGLIHLKRGNVDAATDEFEEVIAEKPTFIQARLLAIGEMFIMSREDK